MSQNNWAKTKEGKKILSNTMIKKYDGKPNNHPFFNKTHTQESKDKNRDAHKNTMRAVIRKNKNNEHYKIYESTGDAVREGFNKTCIWMCCNGKIKTHKGYFWKYLEEEDLNKQDNK